MVDGCHGSDIIANCYRSAVKYCLAD